MKKFRKSHILMAATILVTVAVVSGIKITTKNNSMIQKKGGRGAAEVSVQTMKLKITPLHAYVATNGEIESQTAIEVFPDMAGKIDSVLIELGSPVKRGQIIGWIDPSEPGIRYEKSPVIAPISGNIVTSPLRKGETVSKNKSFVTIGDVENLQISANIPERFVAVLKTGLSAKIRCEAYPEEYFAATISRVSPVVDVATRTKEIILTFDRKDARINAGMFAKIILYTEDYTGAVVMPESAIVNKNDKTYAFIIKEDSTAEQREIKLGKSVDNMIQVLEGLNEGEYAVIAGQTSLTNGSKVIDLSQNVKPKKNSSDKPKQEGAPQDKRKAENGERK